MIRNQAVLAILAVLAFHCLNLSAEAGFVLVTSRAGLNQTGQFNLANLGPAGTTLPRSYTINSTSNEVAIISQTSSSPQRLNERDPSNGWAGNFLPGEALIWTVYGGPVNIEFPTTQIKAIGFQIQPDGYGAFTAYISILNSSNTEIARITRSGSSNSLSDGSALFIGVAATDSNSFFSKIRFGIQNGGVNLLNFAYNDISYTNIVVPEPGSMIFAGISLGVLVLVKKSRHRKNVSC